jgi:4-amino-4-deoxy-L-arabinose transferase-like glycosyltransferase
VSRRRLALVVIVAIALGVRVTYVATTGHTVFGQARTGEIARNIVTHGRWFVRNERAEAYVNMLTTRRNRLVDPGSVDYTALDRGARFYPEISESVGSGVVFAGLWQLTGSGRYLWLQLLQALLDALAVLLVYRIAMQLFNRPRAALLAAALYALYPPIAWDTVDPYNDIWAVDFTIAIVAVYLEALKSTNPRRWLIACGLLTGLAAYFRPNLLLLPSILALATILATGWRVALRRALIVSAIAALLLVPWTIRNYEEFHAFIPTRSGVWEALWSGLGEQPNDFGAAASTAVIKAEVQRVRPDLHFELPAWDAYLKHWVTHAIEQHPGYFLKLLARRAAISTLWMHDSLWMHRGSGAVLDYPGGPLAFAVQRPFNLLQYMLQPAVFLLAMLALGLTWHRFRRQHLILIALVLSVLLPYIAIHVEARYLLPAALAYLLWIGLGADLLLHRLAGTLARVRRRSGTGRAAEHTLQQQPRPRLRQRLVEIAALR